MTVRGSHALKIALECYRLFTNGSPETYWTYIGTDFHQSIVLLYSTCTLVQVIHYMIKVRFKNLISCRVYVLPSEFNVLLEN